MNETGLQRFDLAPSTCVLHQPVIGTDEATVAPRVMTPVRDAEGCDGVRRGA
jgi:hypothetical protein